MSHSKQTWKALTFSGGRSHPHYLPRAQHTTLLGPSYLRHKWHGHCRCRFEHSHQGQVDIARGALWGARTRMLPHLRTISRPISHQTGCQNKQVGTRSVGLHERSSPWSGLCTQAPQTCAGKTILAVDCQLHGPDVASGC